VSAVPGEELIWRVTGARSVTHFHESGARSVEDISRGLAAVGSSFAEHARILDFGCGCGRILRWLDDLGSEVELHGCDIDSEAVAWVAANLPHVHVVQNDGMPPLGYDDDFFDLVFNHSVFTHLPEGLQDEWLAELNRITHPDGLLVLTVSGDHPFAGFRQSLLDVGADSAPWDRIYEAGRLVYIEDDSWVGGPFPDFYHSSFHPPRYVFEHWGRFLEIRAYIVRGALDFQDLIVLRPRSGATGAA
jgi:SAM-dependent methyltransferase